MKHRLLEFLVVQAGFRDFAMEVSPTNGRRLDAFINGNNETVLRRILYWPWATEEVAAQLLWMRRYNAQAAPKAKIRFHGIDPR